MNNLTLDEVNRQIEEREKELQQIAVCLVQLFIYSLTKHLIFRQVLLEQVFLFHIICPRFLQAFLKYQLQKPVFHSPMTKSMIQNLQ